MKSVFGGLITMGVVVFTFGSAAVAVGPLDDVATVRDRTSHRASSYDRSGGNIDNVTSFAPGDTHVMLETDGPGQVNHIWMTVARFPGHIPVMRDLVIRMYWEGSDVPSVEVPLGDFFGLGHGKLYTLESLPIAVGISKAALNCYWPMPFYEHARIEIYNNGDRSIRRIYYNINYELGELPPNQGLFHAEFRRDPQLRTQEHEGNIKGEDNYVILETTGRGQYMGCFLFVDAEPGGWWGEGDEMIYIDGAEMPTMTGTGSEDYFCNAWGFGEEFSYPFYGAPLLEDQPDGSKLTTAYRWHIPDPVRFTKHIKVSIEHLFADEIVNDYSSVAYWYATDPVRERVPLPDSNDPRPHDPPLTYEMDATELEHNLRAMGIKARAISASHHEGYKRGGWLKIQTGDERLEIPIDVPADGTYRVEARPVDHLIEDSIQIGLVGGKKHTVRPVEGGQPEVEYLDLGAVKSEDRKLTLTIQGNRIIGLDHFKIRHMGR